MSRGREDGDFDVYALRVEGGRFYQLIELPGTQTAPYVHRRER
jgi:hypothetical protein